MRETRLNLQLTLQVHIGAKAAVVRGHGIIDLATAPTLRAVLDVLVQEPVHVVVDLTEVNLLDGYSIGMLTGSHRRAVGVGGDLTLRRATGRVLRVLELTGVDKLLETPDTAPEAPDDLVDRTAETLLLARSAATDDEVRQRLRDLVVDHGYDLACSLARVYQGRGEPTEDLVQIAMVGLLKSVDGYDASRGANFNAYAVPTVRGEIRRYFRDKGWRIRVPRRLQEIGRELTTAREELSHRYGHSPTIQEIAEHLNIEQEDVLEALEASQLYRPDSLSTPLRGADGDSDEIVADRLGGPDADLELVENRESLRPLLAALPERQRRILALRFYGNQTQAQIAASVGLSQMHVSRLLADALHRLRAGLVAE